MKNVRHRQKAAACSFFVDESGDPGFKLAKGSSPTFVVAMIIFDDAETAAAAKSTLGKLRTQLRGLREFKFNSCRDETKDHFFDGVGSLKFRTRSTVIKKEAVYSRSLRLSNENFYRFFVRQLIVRDGTLFKDAKLVIDGSGDRTFRREFCAFLRRQFDTSAIRKISLQDSRHDELLQLADMVAGAIARSYKTDRDDPARWRNALARNGQLGEIWEFR